MQVLVLFSYILFPNFLTFQKKNKQEKQSMKELLENV